jgi:hypothetical protein
VSLESAVLLLVFGVANISSLLGTAITYHVLARNFLKFLEPLLEEIQGSKELLQWRDIKTEPPTSDGRYLIVGEIGFVASDYFTLASGWTHKEMMLWTHWRPIGPLPGGE